jgi:hypothetical protein
MLLTKCSIKYKMVKTRLEKKKEEASKYAVPQDLAKRIEELRKPVKPAKAGTRRKARRTSRKKTHKRKY